MGTQAETRVLILAENFADFFSFDEK